MAKTATKGKATQNAKGNQAAPAQQQYIAINSEVPHPNYRGARAAWYQHLVAHNGKPVATFCEAALANPPSTPKRGKLANKCEPPAGWLSFFVRQGIATLVTK